MFENLESGDCIMVLLLLDYYYYSSSSRNLLMLLSNNTRYYYVVMGLLAIQCYRYTQCSQIRTKNSQNVCNLSVRISGMKYDIIIKKVIIKNVCCNLKQTQKQSLNCSINCQ